MEIGFMKKDVYQQLRSAFLDMSPFKLGMKVQ